MTSRIASWIVLLLLAFLAVALIAFGAMAHDLWANGEPVPAWVKRACCGPEDAHHLQPEQVHQTPSGWQVDGYHTVIPNGTELPSPDGSYWIFYRDFYDGSQSIVYCFFIPIPST